MVTYEQIAKANSEIQLVDVKGKQYAEVAQRITAFRKVYPMGSIETEIVSLADGVVVMQATAKTVEGYVLGTGFAYEKEGSTFINKTSYIENCETSAVGRALGFAGFGSDASVASYEEVKNAQLNQSKKSVDLNKALDDFKAQVEAEPQKFVCADCGVEIADAFIANGTKDAYGRTLCKECGLKAKRAKGAEKNG